MKKSEAGLKFFYWLMLIGIIFKVKVGCKSYIFYKINLKNVQTALQKHSLSTAYILSEAIFSALPKLNPETEPSVPEIRSKKI